MKILFRLSFLVLIPLIVGTALALSGYSIGSWILALGVPGVMIVLVVVGLIMMLKGKLFRESSKTDGSETDERHEALQGQDATNEINDSKESESNTELSEQSEKEREQAALNAINSSHFYTNKMKIAEYEAQHITEGMKNTSKKGCVLAIILVLLVVADVVLATVFAIKQIWVGAIVCGAIFGVSVVAGLITAAIRESMSMKGNISRAKQFVCGNVKSCVMSSAVRHERASTPTERISDVVYRIVVRTDGGEYEAYSKRFYEKDDKVVVAVMGKKLTKIIEESDLENQTEEIKNKYEHCIATGDTVIIERAQTQSAHTTAGRSHVHNHRRRH